MENNLDFVVHTYTGQQENIPGTTSITIWLVIIILFLMIVHLYLKLNEPKPKEVQPKEQTQQQPARRDRVANKLVFTKPQVETSNFATMHNSRQTTRSPSPGTPLTNPYLDDVQRGQTPTRRDTFTRSITPDRNSSTEDTNKGGHQKRPSAPSNLRKGASMSKAQNSVTPFSVDHLQERPHTPPTNSCNSKESAVWSNTLGKATDFGR